MPAVTEKPGALTAVGPSRHMALPLDTVVFKPHLGETVWEAVSRVDLDSKRICKIAFLLSAFWPLP